MCSSDLKKQGIPAYYYDNQVNWLNLDTKKTGDISKLTGQDLRHGRVSRIRSYLLPWLELIKSQDRSQLGKKADELRYDLNYSDYGRDQLVNALSTDLGNARKPSSGVDRENSIKIINYMRQNRLNTVKDLVDHLSAKWQSNSQ